MFGVYHFYWCVLIVTSSIIISVIVSDSCYNTGGVYATLVRRQLMPGIVRDGNGNGAAVSSNDSTIIEESGEVSDAALDGLPAVE